MFTWHVQWQEFLKTELRAEAASRSESEFCSQRSNSRRELDKGGRGCCGTRARSRPSRLGKVQAIVFPRILSISTQLIPTARIRANQKHWKFLSIFLIQLATGTFKKTLRERIFQGHIQPLGLNLKASDNQVSNLQGKVLSWITNHIKVN